MTDGSQEKIRCKASYSVGPSGEALNINVNCASDSYRVNIISNVVADGTSFSGTWRETTRQADGKVTGRVPAPGELQASLDGTGFGIQLRRYHERQAASRNHPGRGNRRQKREDFAAQVLNKV